MLKLRRALRAAAAALEKRERRLYADAQVASAAAASLDRDEIADRGLLAIVEQVRADAAVLYISNITAGTLEPIATYALHEEAVPLAFGSGVPGQAAKTCRPVVVRDIPADTPFRIKIGFDQVIPRSVAAIPIPFRREAIGVVLVASLHDLDDDDIIFLRAASAQLAMGLRNAATHAELQRLLATLTEKTRRVPAHNGGQLEP